MAKHKTETAESPDNSTGAKARHEALEGWNGESVVLIAGPSYAAAQKAAEKVGLPTRCFAYVHGVQQLQGRRNNIVINVKTSSEADRADHQDFMNAVMRPEWGFVIRELNID